MRHRASALTMVVALAAGATLALGTAGCVGCSAMAHNGSLEMWFDDTVASPGPVEIDVCGQDADGVERCTEQIVETLESPVDAIGYFPTSRQPADIRVTVTRDGVRLGGGTTTIVPTWSIVDPGPCMRTIYSATVEVSATGLRQV